MPESARFVGTADRGADVTGDIVGAAVVGSAVVGLKVGLEVVGLPVGEFDGLAVGFAVVGYKTDVHYKQGKFE